MKKLVLWLIIGLLLGLALRPIWGQPRVQAPVGMSALEPPGPPREGAADIPVDDLDRGTPRRAVEGFLQAAHVHNYRRAAQYLELRRFPSAEVETLGSQLARHLKIVLDQKLPIDVDSLSDRPAGHLDDGLPPDMEQVERIDTAGQPVHLRLQRVPREDGVGIWKLSAATVAAIPDLYKHYGYGLIGETLPSVFIETEFLDTQLWQWLALPILVGLGNGLGLLVTSLGFSLLRRWRSEPASVLATGRLIDL
jgi:MscS family membrane protein